MKQSVSVLRTMTMIIMALLLIAGIQAPATAEPALSSGGSTSSPSISVTPDSLDEALFTGETSMQLLTISNTGGDDLTFDITLVDTSITSGAADASFTITEFPSDQPEAVPANAIEGTACAPAFGTRIYLNDAEAGSPNNILLLEESCGGSAHFYNDALINLGLSHTFVTDWFTFEAELTGGTTWDLVIVNSYGSSGPISVMDALNDYQATGGRIIFTHWAVFAYPTHPLLAAFGVDYVSDFYQPMNFHAVDPGHRVFNSPNEIDSLVWTSDQCVIDGQIIDVMPGAFELASFVGAATNGAIVLNAEKNCIFNAFQSGNFTGDDDTDGKIDIVELIENEIVFLSGPQWLSVNPSSGTIVAGAALDLEVHFNATGLAGGDYTSLIQITSNDPVDSELVVPSHLLVTAAPDLATDTDSLDFGEVYLGYPESLPLLITNQGTDSLSVTNISSSTGEYTVDITGFQLAPWEDTVVQVTFTPVAAGSVTGSLSITSDDPVNPMVMVVLLGQGLLPPSITVSPSSFSDSLLTGGVATYLMTIDNSAGGSDLEIHLAIEGSAATTARLTTIDHAVPDVLTIPEDATYASDRVIVKLRQNVHVREAYDFRQLLNAHVLREFRLIGAELWSISGISVADAVTLYQDDPRVEYIEPDYQWQAIRTPDDPRYGDLWGMHNVGQSGGTVDADIDAPEAWDLGTGGEVIVGVIDTGVDDDHEDLHGNMWVNEDEIPDNGLDDDGNGYIDDIHGWDFVNNDNDPYDDNGHGTHCAGTIAGMGDNGIGVVGVCWSAKIMALKFLNSSGSGTTADAVSAMEYAIANGANLTSNSWGGGGYSIALLDAISAAGAANQLFIAAAGNSGSNNDSYPHYPSSYELGNIIAVAATDHNDLKAGFSCYGLTSVDLGAPGVNILSSLPGNSYGYKNGTSMAAPHVSGACALVWAKGFSLSNYEVRDIILDNVDSIASLDGLTVTGGRLNVYRALRNTNTWLRVDTVQAVVPAGATLDIEVIFNATGLYGGVYDGNIIVEHNDPGSPVVVIPAQLHVTAAPDIAVEADTLDFGDVYLGYPKCLPLSVFNEGTDTLLVSDINPDAGEFAVDVTSFQLAPFADTVLLVTFTPVAAGPIAGSLTISSNDPDEPIAVVELQGLGRECPEISFYPDTLADSLLVDESGGDTLFLKNAGPDVLEFTFPSYAAAALLADSSREHNNTSHDFGYMEIEKGQADPRSGNPVVLGAGGPDSSGYSWIDSDEPGGPVFDFIDISSTGTLVTGIYDDSYVGPFPIGFSFPFYDSSYTEFYISDNGVIIFDNTFIPWYNQPIPQPDGYNNLLAWCWGDLVIRGGRVYYQQLGNMLVIQFEDYGEWYGYGTVDAEVIIYANGTIVYQYDGFYNYFDPAYYSTVGIENAEGTDGLEVAFNTPYLHDDLAILFSRMPRWITGVAPASGAIAAGDSLAIEVAFSAAQMWGGAYQDSLQIISNDCDNPDTLVFVNLRVTGIPEIVVLPDSLDYGAVFIGLAVIDTLLIFNDGTDLLTITDIVSDNTDYTVDLTSFSLTPTADQEVIVSFAPSVATPIPGTLTITSNDPDQPITTVVLSGEGLVPPDISITPDSLGDSLFTGCVATHWLTVTNDGGSDLEFTIELEYAESLRALAAECLAGITRTQEQETDGEQYTTFSSSELAQFETQLVTFYQEAAVLLDSVEIPEIAIVGDYSYDMLYYLMSDSLLSSRYIFYRLYSYYNYSLLADYDGLVIAEYDHGISEDEAGAVYAFYNSGKPVIMGMDDLDDAPSTVQAFLFPVFGIDGAADGVYSWGSLNPDHPISEGISQVYQFSDSDNDWYTLDSGDWIFTGTDGHYYGVSHIGEAKTVLIGEQLAYVWSQGNDRLIGNAIDWMMYEMNWLSVAPDSGTVPPGGSLDLEVVFNAFRLAGGAYFGSTIILSNDPDEAEIAVPVYLLVTDAPDIVADADSLDFADVYLGFPKSLPLVIINEGTELLTVTSLTADADEFATDLSSFSLIPGADTVIHVAFTPTASGLVTGTMSISSDDPCSSIYPVYLRGIGRECPAMAYHPDTLRDSLLIGETGGDTLFLKNVGPGVLDFTFPYFAAMTLLADPSREQNNTEHDFGYLEIEEGQPDPRQGNPVVMGAGGPDSSGYHWIDSDEPGGPVFNFIDISSTGTPITGLGYNNYVGPFPIGFSFPFYDSNYTEFYIQSNGVINFDDRYISGGNQPIPQTDSYNNLLAWCWDYLGTITGQVYYQQLGHMLVIQFDDYGDYYNGRTVDAEIIIYANGNILYQYDGFHGGFNLLGNTVGIENTDGTDGLEVAFNTEYLHDDLAILFDRVPPWVTDVSPASGTIAAGDSLAIDVTFSAADMLGGAYPGSLDVFANDCDNPDTVVFVNLHVTGIPDITVMPDSLEYGDVFMGLTITDTLMVINDGTDLLTVVDIVSDHADYTVDTTSFSLAPAESQHVLVSFTPSTAAPIPGMLTISSDDPDEPTVMIGLSGSGLAAPNISITPDSIADSLFTGCTATHWLNVANNGGNDLEFTIELEYAESLQALAAACLNGVTRTEEQEIDGESYITFSEAELAQFKAQLATFYEQAAGITANLEMPEIAVAGGYSYDMLYNLMSDSSLVSRYLFYNVGNYFDSSSLASYDGLVVAEYDNGINETEALAISAFSNSGTPVIMGMDELDRATSTVEAYLFPVFGISGAYDGYYNWGSLNPDNPISEGIDQVYSFGGDNDWYILDGSDWILAGTDGNYYGVSYEGESRTVLMGERLTSIWWSGNERLIGNAINWMMHKMTWLSVSPEFGTVPPGANLDIAVTLDAAGLAGDDYYARALVCSNDPDEPEIAVPVYLAVSDAPDIHVDADSLSFGDVYINYPKHLLLNIINEGTDSLLVSEISSNVAEFSPGITEVRLAPNRDTLVQVTFAPSASGVVSGILSITSNDPDESLATVYLIGNGRECPEMAYHPDTLRDSLITGETGGDTLFMKNAGSDILEFTFPYYAAMALLADSSREQNTGHDFGYLEIEEGQPDPRQGNPVVMGAGGPDSTGYRWIDSDEPGGPVFDFIDISSTGTPVTGLWNNNHVGPFSIGFSFPFYDSNYTEFYIQSNGVINFDDYYIPYYNQPVPLADGYNNLLAWCWDDLDGSVGQVYYQQLGDKLVIQFKDYREYYSLGMYGTVDAEVIIYADGHILFQYDGFYDDFDLLHNTVGIENVDGTDGLEVAFNTTYLHDDLAILFSRVPTWVTDVSPASGDIASGDSLAIEVTFSTSDMLGGTYLDSLEISSNVCDDPDTHVYVNLHVTGIPDITVMPDSLDYGDVFMGLTITDTLMVINDGTDLLTVVDIVSDHADYTVDTTSFSLAPAESQQVLVSFTPSTAAPIPGMLTISSNDPDEPIVTVLLQGEGLIPPDISVDPDSLADSLFTAETSTQLLTISNVGTADLEFDIAIEDIISLADPGSSSVSFVITEFPYDQAATEVANDVSGVMCAPMFAKRIYESDAASGGLENILIMEDACGSGFNFHYDDALNNLGLARTLVTTWSALETELTGGTEWGLVIANSYSSIPPSSVLDAMNDYQAAGGSVIYANWGVYDYASHPLLESFGVSFISDFTAPKDFHAVNTAHRMFNNPNVINSLYWTHDQCNRDGQIVDVLPGATQLAFFEGAVSSGALVLNAGGNCIFNAFQSANFNADDDSDGKLDIVELIENEIMFLSGPSWLSVDPSAGVVPGASSMDVFVTFDAAGLNGGNYFADLTITSNDPDEAEVIVPVHLHVTDAPDMRVDADSLDFGDVYIGYPESLPLVVTNEGTALLTVTSLVADADEFTPDISSFSLAPGTDTVVHVTFAPSTSGLVTGTLSIASDDPCTPVLSVYLRGWGRECPEMVFYPDTLADSLLIDETGGDTLILKNVGLDVLEFTFPSYAAMVLLADSSREHNTAHEFGYLELEEGQPDPRQGNPVVMGAGGPDSSNYYWIDSDEPGGPAFNFIDISSTGTQVAGFDHDSYLGPFPIGFSFPFYDSSYTEFFIQAGGVINFDNRYISGSNQPIPRTDSRNNLLAWCWDYLGGDAGRIYYQQLGNMLVIQFDDFGDYYSGRTVDAEVIIYANGSILYQYDGFYNGFNLLSNTVGIENADGTDGLEVAFNTPYLHDDLAILFNRVPQWITAVTPASGAIAAGDSLAIEVTISADDMFGGMYQDSLDVFSNDCDNPDTLIFVNLRVTGIPNIVTLPDSLDYGAVFMGLTVTDTLHIFNDGTDVLTVVDIVSDHADYTVDLSSFSLAPTESQQVLVSFAPSTAGALPGLLTVISNDPDDPALSVSLSGTGLVPPDISVTPDSLGDSLFTGCGATHWLTVANDGGNDLEFTIELEYAESLQALAATCLHGVTRTQAQEIDGVQYATFSESESAEFEARLMTFYQEVAVLLNDGEIPEIAVAGGYSYDMLYYLMSDSVLASRYLFYNVYNNFDSSSLAGYDGLVVAEYDYGVSETEALAISTFYQAGKPILMGMDDVDDEPGTVQAYLFPVFGISDANDGNYFWGSLNPDNPITEGLSQVYSLGNDNDWFTLDGADWIFAGTDGNYYGVSYDGEAKTVLMGENLGDIWWSGSTRLIGNGIDWMMQGRSWLSITPEFGTVPPGGSLDIEITLDAAGLAGADYFANTIIASNDPDEAEVIVPVHLHVTDAPDLRVDADSLDFGDVYIDYPESLPLVVTNEGTAPLTVTSVVADVDEFTADPSGFSLAPDADTVVYVTFTPTASGPVTGILSIISDDPCPATYPVYLRGAARECPDMVYYPETLADSLLVGETGGDTLILKNDGLDVLEFTFPAYAAMALLADSSRPHNTEHDFGYLEIEEGQVDPRAGNPVVMGAGGPDSSGYYWIDSDEPGGPVFNFIDISSTGTLVSGLGGNNYVGPFPIRFSFPFYDNSYTEFYIQSNGVINFDNRYISGSNQPIPQADSYNNLLAWCWNYIYGYTGQVYFQQLENMVVIQFKEYGDNFGRTVDAEVIILANGSILFQYDGFHDDFNLLSNTVGIENAEGTDGLEVAFNTEYLHEDLAVLFSRVPQWITEVTPASGAIASGDSIAVEVTCSAEQLFGGTYRDSLDLFSNDCDNPDTCIFVNLRVTGIPDIAVIPDSLDFGAFFIGLTETAIVLIINEGTDLLTVDSIVADHADYTVDTSNFSLNPGESRKVIVSFAPIDSGLIPGTLTIASNDPLSPTVAVALSGEGILPPIIAVSPASLSDSLFTGEAAVHALTIDNSAGGSDLEFFIEIEGPAATSARLRMMTLQRPTAAVGVPEGVTYTPERVIVKLSQGIQMYEADEIRHDLQAQVLREFPIIGAELWSISEISVTDAVTLYQGDPRVEYIEPDYQWQVMHTPDDPQYGNLWGMHNVGQSGGTVDADIDAPEAWDLGTGGEVIVGVIDTGVDDDHEDLHGNMWVNEDEIPDNGLDDDGNGYIDDIHGWDFVNNDNDPYDDYGHGTHCSGTIAGMGDNGIGVVGVCWSAKIMALKFLDQWGYGSTADAVSAVEYAIVNGANLTSNSWGGGGYSTALYDAISAAGAANQLFVAAAGNYGSNNDSSPLYPCSYELDNILAVAATDHNDLKAGFSCYGATSVDLGAPGVNILSSLPGNSYDYKNGTSMAAPHVSGACALVWAKGEFLSNYEVRHIILDNVDPIASLDGLTVTGGRLNAYRALLNTNTWLRVDILQGVVPAGAFLDLEVTFDAAELYGGVYDANIVVESNDPVQPMVIVPAQLHVTAAPDIAVATDTLNFGDVYLGYPKCLPLFVFNKGTDSLLVTEISLSESDFSVDVTDFRLALFEDTVVQVTFTPVAVGPIAGSLTISSNDPDEPLTVVELQGLGRECPEISFYPDTLKDSLFVDELGGDTLYLKNVGLDVLEFTFPSYAAAALLADSSREHNNTEHDFGYLEIDKGEMDPREGNPLVMGAGGPDSSGYSWIDSDEPGGPVFNFIDISSTGTPVGSVGGNYIGPFPIGFSFPFYDSSHTEFYIQSNGVINFDDRYVSGNNQPIPQADNYNNLLAWCWNYLDGYYGQVYYQQMGNMLVIQFDDYGNYYHNWTVDAEVIIFANGNIMFLYDEFREWFDVVYMTVGIENAEGTDGLEVAFNTPYLHDDLAILFSRMPRWITGVAPASGAIAAGDSLAIEVAFGAANMLGGLYLDTLDLFSNDCDNPDTFICARLRVSGIPEISVTADSLDFGDVYIAYPESLSLSIFNTGTDLLIVTSMVADADEFTADPPSFSLAPYADTIVQVTFSPTESGVVAGILSIISNDSVSAVYPIHLTGRGRECPDMAYYPDTLTDSLLTGETGGDTLILKNIGLGVLEFTFPAYAAAALLADSSLEHNNTAHDFGFLEVPADQPDPREGNPVILGAGGPDSSGYYWIDSDEPGGPVFNFIDISATGMLVTGLENDNYVGPFPLGFSFSFYGNSYTEFYIQSNGVINFDDTYISLSNQPLPQVDSYNNLLAWCWDNLYGANGGVYYQQLGNKAVIQFVNYKEYGGHGTVDAEVIIFANGNILFQYAAFHRGFRLAGNTVGIENATGTDGLEVAFNTEYLHDQLAILFSRVPHWITAVSPVAGVVAAGDSIAIEIAFTAEEMLGGTYLDSLEISTNDCDNHDTLVFVNLQITGVPDIMVFPDSLDYGALFMGLSATDTVVIFNDGTDLLTVTDISSDNPDYTVDTTNFSLTPSANQAIIVTYAPTAVGPIPAILTVTSDDPDEPQATVKLQGEGLLPADIVTRPSSFIRFLLSDEIGAESLMIANHGGVDLEFNIVVQDTHTAGMSVNQALAAIIERSGVLQDEVQVNSVLLESGENTEYVYRNPEEVARVAYSSNPSGLVVAIIAATGKPSRVDDVQDKLQATGKFSSVSIIDATVVTPNPMELSAFDAVLVWSNAHYADPVGLGNSLADYMDNGGGVVCALYEVAATMTSPGYRLGGRWQDDEYFVMLRGDHLQGSQAYLGDVLVPEHPIMEGVSTFDGGEFSFRPATTGLSEGATLIANWSDGQPLVAVKTFNGVKRVDLGFFPPSATVGGSAFWNPETDGDLLMANSLAWAGSEIKWMQAYPLSATIPVGDSMIIDMLLDPTDMGAGDYSAYMTITSNDYRKPEVLIPVHLGVRDPGVVCEVSINWPVRILNPTMEESAHRVAPKDPEPDTIDVTSFWINVLLCDRNEIAVGDSADVYVDINRDGIFDAAEQYPAAVMAEEGQTSQMVAIKVIMGPDLGSCHFPVAIYKIGEIALVKEDGQPVELGRESIAAQGGDGSEEAGSEATVWRYELLANYPNPFNAGTLIFYNLSETGSVTLKIYNILGREVKTLVNETQATGQHGVRWDGRDAHGRPVSSGIYFYRLATQGFTQSRKMVLIR